MKRYVLAIFLSIMLIWMGCSPDKEPVSKKSSGLADQLPASTDVFVRLSSVEKLHQNLAITPETVLGQPIDDVAAISEQIKLNPFDLEALRQAGFATDRPVTLAFTDIAVDPTKDDPNFNLLMIVPVSDGAKVTQYLADTIKANKPDADLKTTDGITTFKPSGDDGPLFWTVKDDTLLIAGNPQTDGLPFLKSVLAGESSLANEDRFKEVAKRIDFEKDLAVYANLGGIVARNQEILVKLSEASTAKTAVPGQPVPDMDRVMSMMAEYEGMGVTLDLGSPHLTVDTVTLIKDQSTMLNVVKDVTIDRETVLGQKTNPVLMMALAFNLPEYFNLLKTMFGDQFAETITNGMAQVKEQTGIDPQADIIDNLGANLNLGIFDGASVTMANPNALLTLSIKDQDKALSTIDKLLEQLPPDRQQFVTKTEVEGIPTYQVNLGATQIYLGVAPSQLILAPGKPMYEKAQQAEMADGFVSKIEDKGLAGSMKNANSIFYIDFAELSHVAKTMGAFAQRNPDARDKFDNAMALLKEFDYLVFSGKMEDRASVGNFTLHTKFQGPFAVRLAQIIEGWKNQPASSATQ